MVLSYLFSELVCMSTIGVQKADCPRDSTIAEEDQELMNSFRVSNVEARECQSTMRAEVEWMYILPELNLS